ncbi:MAG: hypothetical protein KBS39_04235 [Lachnospiraceae bacterium]|nr:hypothetical protein [Candidatus Hippenecus merdae]
MDRKKELSQDERIRAEELKLKRIFKNIGKDKKLLTMNLIRNAAFMAVTLEDLQEDVKANGAVVRGTNGNGFDVTQESPAQKSYNVMINRYASVIKQLGDLLPDAKADTVAKAGEALAMFVTKGK